MDTKQIQSVAADIYRVQSEELDFCSPDDREAGNARPRRGSIPLGRANKINKLVSIEMYGVPFVSGQRFDGIASHATLMVA
jgi:hypothetical protein